MNDYIKIGWSAVRAGDVLMHENGDRRGVRGGGERISVEGLSLEARSWQALGFTPHRETVRVPTESGAYHDRGGVLCVLTPRYEDDPRPWLVAYENMRPYWASATDEDIIGRGPFTRMVPMPSEEQILSAIESPELSEHRSLAEDRAAAVMALLEGESDE